MGASCEEMQAGLGPLLHLSKGRKQNWDGGPHVRVGFEEVLKHLTPLGQSLQQCTTRMSTPHALSLHLHHAAWSDTTSQWWLHITKYKMWMCQFAVGEAAKHKGIKHEQ